jgi:hypothetical protein
MRRKIAEYTVDNLTVCAGDFLSCAGLTHAHRAIRHESMDRTYQRVRAGNADSTIGRSQLFRHRHEIAHIRTVDDCTVKLGSLKWIVSAMAAHTPANKDDIRQPVIKSEFSQCIRDVNFVTWVDPSPFGAATYG